MRILALLVLLPAAAAGDVIPGNGGLLGEWRFDAGDARDSSGRHPPGVPTRIEFAGGAAVFAGSSWIELPLREADLKVAWRTLEVEVRAKFDRPEYYYNTLLSHPAVQVAVHALSSGKGRPCYSLSTVVSDLAPGEGEDPRWGKSRRLGPESKERFYYWGWVGDAATVVPKDAWVTLKTVYDGRQVLQYLDGRLVGTHPVREPGTKASAPAGAAPRAYLGRALSDDGAEHCFRGRIDHVRIRGTR